MNRCSFLFITLLAPCVFTLPAGNVQQAQATLPVLSNTAKKAPPAAKQLPSISATIKIDPQPIAITAKATKKSAKATKANTETICSTDPSPEGTIILGSKGSITSVKEKVAKTSCITASAAPQEVSKRDRKSVV